MSFSEYVPFLAIPIMCVVAAILLIRNYKLFYKDNNKQPEMTKIILLFIFLAVIFVSYIVIMISAANWTGTYPPHGCGIIILIALLAGIFVAINNMKNRAMRERYSQPLQNPGYAHLPPPTYENDDKSPIIIIILIIVVFIILIVAGLILQSMLFRMM